MRLNGGFPILYTDNPWQYDNPQDFDPARGGTPYKQMTIDDLCDLKTSIHPVIAKDCACFMWATLPKLPEALRCLDAWGFKFTAVPFIWVKLNPTGAIWQPSEKCSVMDTVGEIVTSLKPKDIVLQGGILSGLGHWTAGNIEIVLLGKRGRPKRESKSVKQVVFAPRTEHSAKPVEVADRIKILMGGIPGLELFARPPKKRGWLKLGYEMDELDIHEALENLRGFTL